MKIFFEFFEISNALEIFISCRYFFCPLNFIFVVEFRMDANEVAPVTYLYTALAILVVALIFLLQSRQTQNDEVAEDQPEQPVVARRRGPAQAVQAGPGGRRPGFQRRRPDRRQVFINF